MGYKFRVTSSKDQIINIKNKYDEMVSYFLGIDIGVRTLGSEWHLEKPVSMRKLSILAYQALGACLRPCKDFLRRQIRLELF